MKCPYCGNDMSLGDIRGDGYSLKWRSYEEQEERFFNLLTFYKTIKLTSIWDNSVEAYCCYVCQKIIIDIPEFE